MPRPKKRPRRDRGDDEGAARPTWVEDLDERTREWLERAIAEAPMRHRPAVRRFLETGICELPAALSREQVTACRREVYGMYTRTMSIIDRADLREELMTTGFTDFKLRHAGRYDLQITDFEAESFSFLRSRAPWLPLVRAILGPDCTLCNTGVMLSMPGSATQPWHSDGDHLPGKRHKGPHCLNVFVPLVTLNRDNGGTEMVPGTHFLGAYDEARPSTTIHAAAGSCILFDFRLRHRGLGNGGPRPRPLMYITYCIPSFKDTMNFSTRRYLKLPALEQPRTQGGRAAAEDTTDWEALIEHDSEAEAEEELRAERQRAAAAAERKREQRARHRKAQAAAEVEVRGIRFFPKAQVLARDSKHGWFMATMTEVHPERRTVRVHFNGWHKRFDFECPFTDRRLKPAPPRLLFKGVRDRVAD